MKFKFLLPLPICLAIILLTSACGRRESPPAAITAKPASGAKEISGKASWEIEWDRTLAGARKEGKVVIYGAPGSEVRTGMVEGFQRAYPEIVVDYIGAPSAQNVAKINAERRAGLYIPDIYLAGTITVLTNLVLTDRPVAHPIQELLILPEVKDGKNWLGGKLAFADNEGKYNLIFCGFVVPPMIYNTDLIPPEKASSFSLWQLTKPEMKGKVVWADPRISGTGLSSATFFYVHPQLGPDFMRSLAGNDVILSRDARQMAEWVGRGKISRPTGSRCPDHQRNDQGRHAPQVPEQGPGGSGVAFFRGRHDGGAG